MSFSDSARARWALPFPLSTHFGGVDQGVDYKPTGSVKAIAPGMIYHHSKPGSWRSIGGNGEAVYERLDYPARIHGRTYRNVYYAEQKSIVKHGSVNAGQPVMIGGWDELGFAKTCTCDPAPFAPFPGRDAQGHTPATQAGRDFYDFLRWIQRYLRARR